MKKIIEYVKEKLEKTGNVSIYLPPLTNKQIAELHENFDVRKEPFGYYRFSKKTK